MVTTYRARPAEADDLRGVRRDLVTAGIGWVLVGGVFTDGWAHFNRPGLETFFTPWHAVLYSSLGVMTIWLTWVAWRAADGMTRHLCARKGCSAPTGRVEGGPYPHCCHLHSCLRWAPSS